MASPSDSAFMSRAIEIAARGRGFVEPNPMVGCVIVRDGLVVAEGWHERFGGPHAEVNALLAAAQCESSSSASRSQAASSNAISAEPLHGSTMYVSLEPCCHHGKTPPCVDQIIRSGIRRVVAAMSDPFPAVQGGGVTRLRDAGIEVDVGVCETQARELNAPYLHLLREQAPWVIGKWAMSLDGKIATRSGDSRWISNDRSREIAHTVRGRVDAIVVGRGTVDQDNPLLTARPSGPRVATRVVMSSRGLLPRDCALLRTAREVPVLVVVTTQATPEACRDLERAGCEVLVVDAEDQTKQLGEMLKLFGNRRWTNILVEGGGQILGRFLDGGLLDEVHVFIAPKLIGGMDAKSPLAGAGASVLAESTRFEQVVVECVDNDIWVRARGPRVGAGDGIAPRPG